jgi:hypothetical protein
MSGLSEKPPKIATLQALHKDLGVRRDNLRGFLGQWPNRWGLATAGSIVVRVHLIHWVNEIVNGFSSSVLRTIGQVAYNTTWDLDLRDLRFGARLRRLHEVRGQEFNEHTARFKVRGVVIERVSTELSTRGPADRLAPDLVRSLTEREATYAAAPGGADTTTDGSTALDQERIAAAARFQQAVRGLRGISLNDVIEQFRNLRLYVPGTADRILVVDTPTYGCLTYAFTSTSSLHEYRSATNNGRMAEWSELTGGELIDHIGRLPMPTGIVVDPVDGGRSDVDAMLTLPASLIAGMRPENGR